METELDNEKARELLDKILSHSKLRKSASEWEYNTIQRIRSETGFSKKQLQIISEVWDKIQRCSP